MYITSPIIRKIEKEKKLKKVIENLDKEIEELNLVSFRDFLVSKGRNWFLENKEPIKEIMVKKYGLEQGWYNYIFLTKTFAFGIDRRIKEGKW